ncbi:MAG: chitobiase/beta-hexosaminidase C-terminal domain-containing protein, partial [Lachnospiraceae bacterium]|nr:chitobiase/beta-hexosaminidase C-terminal domain-containing protein [Lachnospiraceae bacterium]
GYLVYEKINSYSHQYQSSIKNYNIGEYDKALESIDSAIALDDTHPTAYCLLSKILQAEGDKDGAIKIMEASLDKFPNSTSIYEEIISLYVLDKKPEKIKRVLDNCQNNKIREKFPAYITPDPQINYETGTYGKELTVKIDGDCKSYYYTLNGKKPNKKSEHYKEPIQIGEGSTELNVIGYNKEGIPSDVIYRKYIISIKGPEAPLIMPEETSFDEKTLISIEIPDGCECFYSFDTIPTLSSTQYTGPIDMPEGTHVLYVFLVGGNGKQSDMSSKTYTLIY